MMEQVVSLISSVGFPIVCVMFLWKYVNSTLKEFTQTMHENTQMLQKVYEKLDAIDRVHDGGNAPRLLLCKKTIDI